MMSTANRKNFWALASACILLVLGWSSAMGQPVYRIVGPDGKVTFSDKPPAASDNATLAGAAASRTSNTAPASLPYDLRQVVSRYPVTLYSSSNCGPCSSGRNMLMLRGVPFTERTISTNEDNEALQRLSGENALPFLTIGAQRIKGYSDVEWQQFLDAAGYPKASQLPANYRNPPPAALVAVQPPASAQDQAKAAAPNAPVDAPLPPPVADAPSNPTGIRF